MIGLFKRKKKLLPKEEVIFFSIHNLLLKDFIDIVCDGKVWSVVKAGKPTLEEVTAHWDALFLEYSDIIGETDYAAAIETQKELEQLRAKIELVYSATKVLSEIYVQDLVDFINTEYDFNFQYFEDATKYYKQFKRIEGRLKMWKVDYDLLLIKNPVNNEEVKPIDRDAFVQIRLELGSFVGYPVREHDTTVAEFAGLIKKLRKYNASLEKINKKK